MTKQQLMTSPVFAVVYGMHGKRLVSFYNDFVPHSVRVERLVGGVFPVEQVFEISPSHWGKDLGELLTLFNLGKLQQDSVEVDEFKDGETEQEARTRRLPTLDGIIRTSNQEGEVASARKLWKEYTGKEWEP